MGFPPSDQSYPTHTFQSSSVLPTFINGGENICWLNSSMHLLLALYKQQNHNTANNHLIHEESLFWNFIEYLKTSKPRQHELFSPQQICKVGNSLKTMRYLFAKIAVDNTNLYDNQKREQQDVSEALGSFLQRQQKLTNYHTQIRERKTCTACARITYSTLTKEKLDFMVQTMTNDVPKFIIKEILENQLTNIQDEHCVQCNILQMHTYHQQISQPNDCLLLEINRQIDKVQILNVYDLINSLEKDYFPHS